MLKNTLFAMALSLPLAATAGCDPNSEADRAGERAEDRAEEMAEENGYGPLDEHIRGEIAEEGAELAHDVGGEPGAQDGRTAAQRLDAVEDGEEEESGY